MYNRRKSNEKDHKNLVLRRVMDNDVVRYIFFGGCTTLVNPDMFLYIMEYLSSEI